MTSVPLFDRDLKQSSNYFKMYHRIATQKKPFPLMRVQSSGEKKKEKKIGKERRTNIKTGTTNVTLVASSKNTRDAAHR